MSLILRWCAVCADSTAPSVTVNEKNEVPSVEKKVKAGSSYEATNTAKIGDTVEFKTEINVKKGAANYVLHDKMDAGLTLDSSSIKVTVDGADVTADATKYEIKTTGKTHPIARSKLYLQTLMLQDLQTKPLWLPTMQH